MEKKESIVKDEIGKEGIIKILWKRFLSLKLSLWWSCWLILFFGVDDDIYFFVCICRMVYKENYYGKGELFESCWVLVIMIGDLCIR